MLVSEPVAVIHPQGLAGPIRGLRPLLPLLLARRRDEHAAEVAVLGGDRFIVGGEGGFLGGGEAWSFHGVLGLKDVRARGKASEPPKARECPGL